jgi:hypothetical protein
VGCAHVRALGVPRRRPARRAPLFTGDLIDGITALGVFFDGIARHTPEGYAFQQRAAEVGFKEVVRERDAPYDG